MTPSELKALRIAAGLTQEVAAERLGLHELTVNRYERGSRTIPPLSGPGIRAILEPLATRKDGVKTAPRPAKKARKS
jgi:transcriptional regulator with XRE-family HTH domain